MKWIMTTLLASFLSFPVWAQTSDLESLPGYVDFGSLDAIYGEPRVMINIGGPLMKLMAAVAATSDDPEAAALMQGLEGVRVNIYDTAGNTEPALAQMSQVKAALQAEQWQPIVQVQEEGENVQMFTRLNGEVMDQLNVGIDY